MGLAGREGGAEMDGTGLRFPDGVVGGKEGETGPGNQDPETEENRFGELREWHRIGWETGFWKLWKWHWIGWETGSWKMKTGFGEMRSEKSSSRHFLLGKLFCSNA